MIQSNESREANADLRGRHAECAALARSIAAARRGESAVLVLLGEAGIGKSALLDYATRSASDLRVLRVGGVESEMELPFAGLHQLCGPVLDHLEGLPQPQLEALEIAFGMRVGQSADVFFTGLATLTLLSSLAEEGPLLCVVDDAQWLDRESAQVLGFVSRRLLAEPIALLFGTREIRPELNDLPALLVTGLHNGDAQALLHSAVQVVLDARVSSRIVAETRGNPLALIELPRGLTITQLAGGLGLVGASELTDRIEDTFVARFEQLPPDVRMLLVVAAAESDGDPLLIARAAERLGISVGPAAARADAEGLWVLRERATFRHPIVRSGVYRAATADERRVAHTALAAAIDADTDPDRRAWHRAAATIGPDDRVADELEAAADRARARGGLAAAAAFLQRSAALTTDPETRGSRAIAAARVSLDAGDFDSARRLLNSIHERPLAPQDDLLADLLRGQLAFAAGPGRDAPPLLLAAARRLEVMDVDAARETYLAALGAVAFAGSLVEAHVIREICRGALALPQSSTGPRPLGLLVESLALLLLEGPGTAAGKLREAGRVFAADDIPVNDVLRWGWAACAASGAVWDMDTTVAIARRQVDVLRAVGALGHLPVQLSALGVAAAWLGDLNSVEALVAEAATVAAATGTNLAPYADLRLRALRGIESEALPLIRATLDRAAEDGQGMALTQAQWAAAVLYNGLGQYDAAAEAAAQATNDRFGPWISMWALPEAIEAGVRMGSQQVAREAMTRLEAATENCGEDLGVGVALRCQALLAEDSRAEALYTQAIQVLGRTSIRPELARAHLLHGEWLRRQGRRTDARIQLNAAHDLFSSIGMEAFAERARRELSVTGETVRKRQGSANATSELTAQEEQIARLVRDGLSNPEIGARLFISPRTVQYHLKKVFTKLGVTSRTQLHLVLLSDGHPTSGRRNE